MKRKLEEQIKESDKYNPSTIEAEYDNYDSQEEIIDEEMEQDLFSHCMKLSLIIKELNILNTCKIMMLKV